MGKSIQRARYFEKHVRYSETPQDYIFGLEQSPYKTHRRMAVALTPMMENLLKEQENNATTSEV